MTKTQLCHKLKYHKIFFLHNCHFSCPIMSQVCTEHGSITAVLCAKFQHDWTTVIIAMDEWHITKFEVTTYLGWHSDIATVSSSHYSLPTCQGCGVLTLGSGLTCDQHETIRLMLVINPGWTWLGNMQPDGRTLMRDRWVYSQIYNFDAWLMCYKVGGTIGMT